MIELAWLWLRHQPDSALSHWFKQRVSAWRRAATVRRVPPFAVRRWNRDVRRSRERCGRARIAELRTKKVATTTAGSRQVVEQSMIVAFPPVREHLIGQLLYYMGDDYTCQAQWQRRQGGRSGALASYMQPGSVIDIV
jgi:hypothetical protein